MGSREYTRRLGTIDDAQFQTALKRLGLGDFVGAEPVAGGLFGQNVFVTSTQGEWVLRGVPHYDWQLPSEHFFARLLHERTRVPVPWPYRVDQSNDIFGWSYAVMPRLPGVRPADHQAAAGLGRDERIGMARAMAEPLALVHDLTWPYPGRYDLAADTIVPLAVDWPDWVAAEVEEWLERAGHSPQTTDADGMWVDGLLAAARAALGEPFQPCVVLRDYGEHNVVMRRTAAGWRVSGVFDLMEASFGDGEMDLARQTAAYLDEDVELARTYLRSYLELRPPRPGFRSRFPVYMLRDRLIIWEYFQRPGMQPPWAPQLTLREWADPYTAAYEVLLGTGANALVRGTE